MNTDDRGMVNATVSRMQVLLRCMMVFVGISGCFSVLFGAWLAHAGQTLPLNVQSSLEIALQYQFIHTLTLFVSLVWLKSIMPSKVLFSACIAFITGILCFCGVIYIKTFFELAVLFPLIGKLTPIGGIAFAIAWLLLAFESKNSF